MCVVSLMWIIDALLLVVRHQVAATFRPTCMQMLHFECVVRQIYVHGLSLNPITILTVCLVGVYSDTTQLNWTQLNSTRQREQQLTQFVGRDVINKNTTDLAVRCSTRSVELSWVELSCLAINTPLVSTLKPHSNVDHYTAIRWSVDWPLMGKLLHLVQRGEAWAGCAPA